MTPCRKPLVTVITLCFNSLYLFDTIRSVLSQNYSPIQYIVSDDGTDGFDTESIRRYIMQNKKDNIVDVIIEHHSTNIGTVRNYNSALSIAQGDYIFPLSGDDVFQRPTTLSHLVQAFQRCHDPVMGSCCAVYDKTLRHYRGRWPSFSQIRLLKSRNWEQIYHAHETQKILPGCTLARTKESIQTLGYFDQEYRLLEDYPFIMKTLRAGIPIGFYPKVTVKKRSGGVSDAEHMNPVLSQDMEKFYDKEVFPYCSDSAALKKILQNNSLRSQSMSQTNNLWENGTLFDKVQLFFMKPSLILKKILRNVFRI